MSSIRMTNVSKTYGQVPIISSFSCLFPDQQFITLRGPSGCGKTTLLRLIAGFEKVSSGVIAIDDVPEFEKRLIQELQSTNVLPTLRSGVIDDAVGAEIERAAQQVTEGLKR